MIGRSRTGAVAMLVSVIANGACGKSSPLPQPRTQDAAPQPEPATAELGRQIFDKKGCIMCHSVDGTIKVGPSAKGMVTRALSGETRFADGTVAKDLIGSGKTFPSVREYLVAETLRPQERLIAGYPPSAPPYEGQLTPRDLDALVLYIESLDAAAPPPP